LKLSARIIALGFSLLRRQNTEHAMKTVSGFLMSAIVVLGGQTSVNAGLTLYEPGLTPVLRASGFQAYPLAIDSSGDVYTVTGTSPSDQLLEVTTSGQVNTINTAVGGVIGTNAKLAFGFGGNLFATAQGGIIEFSLSTGSGSFFYSGNQDGDAALAYDAKNQLLWVTNSGGINNLIALNSSGNVVETISTPLGGYGLALDKAGNLICISDNAIIYSINPNTQAVTQIANLTSVLPNTEARSLAIDPNTGDIYFSVQPGFNEPPDAASGLYEISPDGTGLSLIATGFNGQMAFGASSAGNGQTSIYLGDPNDYQLYEVQSSVPEPSSLMIAVAGALTWVGYGCVRRLRETAAF
jgi:hypothetical protein